jgi:cell wall-associated NlpC family hydrolase
MRLDPRLHAVRPDLADAALAGQIEAARFVTPETARVTAPQAALRQAPSADAMMLTEALFGEAVAVFEVREGWAWVQLAADRYVGWMAADAISAEAGAPTHKVAAPSTFAFDGPDIKRPPLMVLPMGAVVRVCGEAEDRNARYALIEPAGAVVTQHLALLDAREADWSTVAERFLGSPYLWGGKTRGGIDCSGLVQVALAACGIGAPRDTDMQEAALGAALPLEAGLPALRRGDLVFWKGHVGIMCDPETLLHANAHAMAVAAEPLATAIARTQARGAPVTSIRRIAGQ